mgnify:CR=1 FL=1
MDEQKRTRKIDSCLPSMAQQASHVRRSFAFEIRGAEEASGIMVKKLHQQITKMA